MTGPNSYAPCRVEHQPGRTDMPPVVAPAGTTDRPHLAPGAVRRPRTGPALNGVRERFPLGRALAQHPAIPRLSPFQTHSRPATAGIAGVQKDNPGSVKGQLDSV
jgi:hypothetical protein